MLIWIAVLVVYLLLGAGTLVAEVRSHNGNLSAGHWAAITVAALVLGGLLVLVMLTVSWVPWGVGYAIGFILTNVRNGYQKGKERAGD